MDKKFKREGSTFIHEPSNPMQAFNTSDNKIKITTPKAKTDLELCLKRIEFLEAQVELLKKVNDKNIINIVELQVKFNELLTILQNLINNKNLA